MKRVKKRNTIVTNNWVIPKRFLLFYLFILLILLGQFAHISLFTKVNGNNLKEIAANRTTVSKELIARRGNVYDNSGNMLATNVTSYTLFAYLSSTRTTDPNKPNHVVNKELTAKKLSEVLDAPYDYIYSRLNENKYQVEFGSYGSKLTELEKIAIEKLELPGIDFIESTKRFYPNGQFASYIIGYAKEYTRINLKLKENFDIKEYYKNYFNRYDDAKLIIYNENIVVDNKDTIKAIKVGSTFFKIVIGKDEKPLVTGILNVTKNDISTRTDIVTEGELGVESKYDSYLKGTNGSITYQRDPSGYQIPDTPEERKDAIDGKDIYLTIDSSIQRFLEEAVKKEVDEYHPEWMIMVAMDAKTGEILGSATSPNFNPNSLASNMSYQNPLVSYEYEPGSVMKIYSYLCAADTGKYNGSKKFKSGSIQIGKNRVNDWKPSGWGSITYDIGFTYSSNVGAINVAKDYLSPSKLKACLKSYGFGEKTGVELSSEVRGNVNYNENVDIDWLSVSFGQGLTATAVQQIQALTIIANDGYMVKPHIIKKVVDNNTGEETVVEVEKSQRIVSSEAVKSVKKLMYDTVQLKTATGYGYYIEGFDVIGKTGTAQIAEKGKYLTGDGNYVVSFAGMFPYDNPEIIIYSAIKKPKTHATKSIAPYVVDVIHNIAKYKNMYSEINEKKSSMQKYSIKSYISSDTDKAKEELNKMKMNIVLIGDGDKIINQYPNRGSTIITGDKIYLVTNSTKIEMPDITGWSLSDVRRFVEYCNINFEYSGHGYVVKQSIKPKTILKGESLSVELKDKEIKKEEKKKEKDNKDKDKKDKDKKEE